MPNFKQKNTKKIRVDKNKTITLDYKHNNIMNDFLNEKTIEIPKLTEEKEVLKNKLKNKLKNQELSVDDILYIKDRIREINILLKDKKNQEMEYLLQNSNHIFHYFENKKNITECKNKTTVLDNYFKTGDYNNKVEEKNKHYDNVNKYFSNVDETVLDINNYILQTDICTNCNEGELIPISQEGQLVCNNCSCILQYIVENEKPSYKEPPKEVCFYAYKRINHFREVLAQFQAKETTQIPEEILEDIKLQIKKERITIDQLTNNKAKEILKKLGYNKYYEHIPFIKDKLGIKPPVMKPELEEKLCNLFLEIQGPYAKFCPDNRVNFLNYYYTVYKLCELLNQTEFLSYFPMLKDREKRIEQDYIWKQICGELKWTFIPTV